MSTRSSGLPMAGKTVLVTGANRGLGFVSARVLAGQGATVIMVCRDGRRGAQAREEIARVATIAPPVLLEADLASQASVRHLAQEVAARFTCLDVLMNNAGAIFATRELTVDGIERTFATNHLAPFLLTHLLLDRLRAAPDGRVVTVAAEPFVSRLDFDNLQSEKRHNFMAAYFRSKLSNILFTLELARRLEGSNVTANCLSPGPTATRFADNLSGRAALFHLILAPLKRLPFLFASVEKGARTQVYLAASPDVARVSGRFFLYGRERAIKTVADDRAGAARLWEISEQLCGLTATREAA